VDRVWVRLGMLDRMTQCPDRDLLERLLSDRLADTEVETVEHHIQDCASCQQILEELSGDATWRAELRKEVSVLLDDAGLDVVVDPLGATAGAWDGTLDASPRVVPTVPGYEITGELGPCGMGVVYRAFEAKRGEVMGPALGEWTHQGFHVPHNEWYGAHVQIRLYRGDGSAAWNFFTTMYSPAIARSHLTRILGVRTFFYERRARCALAAPFGAAVGGPLLRSAERDARRLEREGMARSKAPSLPIRAGVAAARGDRSRAARLFALAIEQLDAVDMNLYAAASRRRLGETLGGSEGQAQLEIADSWMNEQGIRKPARMADVFAPVVG
jgi:hypothetical protein